MGPSHPGLLVDRGPSDPVMSRLGPLVEPWGFRRKRKTPRTSGLTRRPSDSGLNPSGQQVTLGAIGTEGDSPQRAGQSHGSLDTGPGGPGLLVDTVGPRSQVRVTRDSWSTPRALTPKHEMPGTADPTREPSDMGPSLPGQLVDTARLRAWARVPQDSLSTPQALGPGPESPGTVDRTCVYSARGPSQAGELVDSAGHRTQARFSRESLSNMWALGPGPEWPRKDGRHRGP